MYFWSVYLLIMYYQQLLTTISHFALIFKTMKQPFQLTVNYLNSIDMHAVETGISEKMYLRTMEIDHPIERIDWLIDEFYDGKPKRWTDAMGLAASAYTNLKNGSFPSWKVIVNIKKAHPEISLEWLIMNNEMFENS